MDSVECSDKIHQKFSDAGVDVVLNADHTFVRFHPGKEFVLAPMGAKCIGGKINLDEKAGFTCMVGTELDPSRLIPPFLVFNGTKCVDATNLEQTNWFKYRNWNKEAPGHTARQKHWFDADITIDGWTFCSTKLTLAKRLD